MHSSGSATKHKVAQNVARAMPRKRDEKFDDLRGELFVDRQGSPVHIVMTIRSGEYFAAAAKS